VQLGRSWRLGERTGDKAVTRSGTGFVRGNIEGRGVAMINASQIKEHMEVKGSDGKHVGTVLGVEGEQVKIASGGMDHFIDIATVDAVDGEKISLKTSAEEAVRRWH
jgi:hypothetical protein